MNAMRPISISSRLRGRVFAQGPEALDVAALGRQFGAYHAEVSAQAATIAHQGATIELLKKDIDRLALQIAGDRTNGTGGGLHRPDPLHHYLGDFMQSKGANKVEFSDYVAGRMQDPNFQAAMSIGSEPDGGYTVIDSVENGIRNIAQNVSPFRSLASVVTIGGGSYDIVISPNLSSASWVVDKLLAQPRHLRRSIKYLWIRVFCTRCRRRPRFFFLTHGSTWPHGL